MSRYKLGVFSRKNEGRIINLDEIIKLKDLKNLDEFTTSFNNESELKAYLFNQALITNEELSQNISIRYKYNGKIKKLQIFYQDMKKYLDITHLRYELKGLSSNIEFLEKLANFYSNGRTSFNKQGLNVSDIRHYLSDVRNNREDILYSNMLMLETAIDDLFKKAIIRDADKQTGEVKEDYRGMRDLALFIFKFKKSQEKAQQNEVLKKLDDIWEQPTVFDILNEDTVEQVKEETYDISNFGADREPDFAPNSEEERNYQRYMENLPNEEHPHYRR